MFLGGRPVGEWHSGVLRNGMVCKFESMVAGDVFFRLIFFIDEGTSNTKVLGNVLN